MHYYSRTHQTLDPQRDPAMEADVSARVWSFERSIGLGPEVPAARPVDPS